MAIIAKETGGNYVPAPEGVHQAVCCDVVDLGMVEATYNNEKRSAHKIRVIWELDEEMQDGKRFTASKQYTLSLHEKANLRKELQSWRGRSFTDKELMGFDLENLLGANCMLNILHVHRNGSTYGNIQAIMPLPRNMQKISVSPVYVRVTDRKPKDAPNGNANELQDEPRQADDPARYDPSDDDIPF